MNVIKVCAASLNQTPLAWDLNKQNILSAVSAARTEGCSVLALPELCITGYGCEDAFFSVDVHRTAVDVLLEISSSAKGIIVNAGLPVLYENGLFNCSALLVDGEIAGFSAKRFLAGEGIHYEPRWFKPWPKGLVAQIAVDGRKIPIGDLIYQCGEFRLGFEICEDAWAAERPGIEFAAQGVDLIVNPSASHFAFDKIGVRRGFVLEGSRAYGCAYLYANLLGNEAGRAIYDGGSMIAAEGKLLASAPRLSFKQVEVAEALVDIDKLRAARARNRSIAPVASTKRTFVQSKFEIPETTPLLRETGAAPWEHSTALKEEEFCRAVMLGLFDYLRKSRSSGFVVSISGGADSAAISCLVALMVRAALTELGPEEFQKRFPCPCGWTAADPVKSLLTCLYQATENSSVVTFEAASAVAQAIGAEFYRFEVGGVVHSYINMVSEAVERTLSWEEDDIALQNIQARVRGPGAWLVANIKNALLLATSNRSEAAVGYTTMDGDTCGSLSPIAGIDKAFLRRWLCWLETKGPEGLGSIPELRLVNAQQPTAELRPAARRQTDEQDLMPYPVLDFIERAAIRDKKAPAEVLLLTKREFGSEFGEEQLSFWVKRFFRLWCRNQWKRERYAPCFHLDDENLDPKTWCRFPILSGGYERELEKL